MLAGLGSATALNDGYPFGLWIAFDVVTGAALACGGYAVGLLVYILNKGKYHPLMRPAMVTSALGYTLAGIGVGLDVGRWWSLWRVPLFFWRWNFNSALLEVALCIMAYIAILWLRLAPALLELYTSGPESPWRRSRGQVQRRSIDKLSVPMIALGLVLATMHQSSLGTLMLLAGSRLHLLWRTPLLPLMFLVSCISMGYAVVVFESAFSSVAFKRKPEIDMLAGLAGAMVPTCGSCSSRCASATCVWRGQLGALFAGDGRSVMASLEIALLPRPRGDARVAGAGAAICGDLVRAAMADDLRRRRSSDSTRSWWRSCPARNWALLPERARDGGHHRPRGVRGARLHRHREDIPDSVRRDTARRMRKGRQSDEHAHHGRSRSPASRAICASTSRWTAAW